MAVNLESLKTEAIYTLGSMALDLGEKTIFGKLGGMGSTLAGFVKNKFLGSLDHFSTEDNSSLLNPKLIDWDKSIAEFTQYSFQSLAYMGAGAATTGMMNLLLRHKVASALASCLAGSKPAMLTPVLGAQLIAPSLLQIAGEIFAGQPAHFFTLDKIFSGITVLLGSLLVGLPLSRKGSPPPADYPAALGEAFCGKNLRTNRNGHFEAPSLSGLLRLFTRKNLAEAKSLVTHPLPQQEPKLTLQLCSASFLNDEKVSVQIQPTQTHPSNNYTYLTLKLDPNDEGIDHLAASPGQQSLFGHLVYLNTEIPLTNRYAPQALAGYVSRELGYTGQRFSLNDLKAHLERNHPVHLLANSAKLRENSAPSGSQMKIHLYVNKHDPSQASLDVTTHDPEKFELGGNRNMAIILTSTDDGFVVTRIERQHNLAAYDFILQALGIDGTPFIRPRKKKKIT